METPVGRVARIATRLTWRDRLGHLGVRLGIKRMRYTVPAGLFAVGEPGADSPILVTANYKLGFDLLRRELAGQNLWLLVLETFGINVWCAAGKGTFGTRELVRRLEKVRLGSLLTHRTVILPQLGAPGVAAHQVRKSTGFRVRYGPIRAADLPEYLHGGLKATPEMRRVQFPLKDRLVLTPVELVNSWKPSLVILAAIFLVSAFKGGGFAAGRALSVGFLPAVAYLGALLTGAVITPLLLPWIPGKSFSFKGAQLGVLWALLVSIFVPASWGALEFAALFLLIPAICFRVGPSQHTEILIVNWKLLPALLLRSLLFTSK